jgi:hemin uptake protein HemP
MESTTRELALPLKAVRPSPDVPPRIRSEDLFFARREIVIEHAGREYRLRLTNRGRLILTA